MRKAIMMTITILLWLIYIGIAVVFVGFVWGAFAGTEQAGYPVAFLRIFAGGKRYQEDFGYYELRYYATMMMSFLFMLSVPLLIIRHKLLTNGASRHSPRSTNRETKK